MTAIDAGAFEGCGEALIIISAYEAYAREYALENGIRWQHDVHTEIIGDPGFLPTCAECGQEPYSYCDVCGEELQHGHEIPPAGHSEIVTVEAVEATCTQDGCTQEISCEVCGEILVPSEVIPATGHTEIVTREAVQPSCTAEGRTEEISCQICSEVLQASVTIPMSEHMPEVIGAVPAGCLETGLTEGSRCSVCEAILKEQEIVPALGHLPEAVEAVMPTDRTPGLTEGSRCGRCGTVLVEQEVIPANFSYDETGTIAIAYNGSAADIVIPDGVTALGSDLFRGNEAIRTVRLSPEVTALGDYTFNGCSGLTDIFLSDNIAEVASTAFTGVTANLHASADGETAVALSRRAKSFTLEDGFRYRYAFSDGEISAVLVTGYIGEESDIAIPDKINDTDVTTIYTSAFVGHSELCSLRIPDSVTRILANAFEGCSDALVIRTSAGAYARIFAENNGMLWEHDVHTHEIIPAILPNCTETGLTEGEWCPDCGFVFVQQEIDPATGHTEAVRAAVPATRRQDGCTEERYCSVCEAVLTEGEVIPKYTDLTVLQLPEQLVSVEEEAFTGCPAQCIVLNDRCESIGCRAFAECSDLILIEIPASVTAIADDAFEGAANAVVVTPEGSFAESWADQHEMACRCETLSDVNQ